MPANRQLEPERGAALPAPEAAAVAAEAAAPSHPLLRMQRQLGNARVARMRAVQRATPDEDREDDLLQAMRDPAVQRDDDTDDDDEKDGLLQAMPEVGLEGGPVSDGLAQRIDSRRGAGAPLDGGVRTQMESSMGTNFESVRVHSDSESQHLSRAISAKAFTTGNDIFLGAGASPSDSSLLAHELTHVVQQRSMASSGPMTVGPADDSFEREAESTAHAVTSGGQPALARKTDE